MSSELKITLQEMKIIEYLRTKNGFTVAWEELAQFAKCPQQVKMKSIQKAVSEIKRKYNAAGLPFPFDVKFSSLVSQTLKTSPPMKQNLVQVKRTPSGNTMIVDNKLKTHSVHTDFVLDRNSMSVITNVGARKLNHPEWEMMVHFNDNANRLIGISELRDKVKYPLAGSKLPARWFSSIMSCINNLRRTVPGLKNRILTVKTDGEISYLYQ